MGSGSKYGPKPGRGCSAAMVGAGGVGLGALGLLLFGLVQGLLFPRTADARLLLEANGFAGAAVRSLAASDPHFVTKTPGLAISEFCEPEHSSTLAQKFLNLTVDIPYWTACGEMRWIDQLAKLDTTGPKTFFDIGCNKGFTSAKFFGLWAPEVGFNPKGIVAKRPDVYCGNCGDCNEDMHPAVQQAPEEGVRVFCFEPSQANFAQLVITRDVFFKDNRPEVQWFTMNLAMTNATGVAHFSRECTSEQCALDLASAHNYDLIYTTSVDAFLRKHEIERVDVLKIDTEGYDATVIIGAMESISRGSVGIISFEYHEVGVWRQYKLKHVVEWLNGFNYVCYFDGKTWEGAHFARLTGCWDDKFEYYNWSNVVCVPRSHALYPWMETKSLRHVMYKAAYYQEEGQPQGPSSGGGGAKA